MIQQLISDPAVLKQVSQPATSADWPVATDLLETLQAHGDNCIGLAAIMIGIPKRIIAVTLGPVNVPMLNPRLTKKLQPYQATADCLCLPGKKTTTRYKQITVAFQTPQGEEQQLNLSGIAAEAVQHELDHCNGILI